MDNDVVTHVVDGREITLVQRPWNLPEDKEKFDNCANCMYKNIANVGRLYSSYWPDKAQLPDADDPNPTVELQVTCDGVNKGAGYCNLKMVQFDPETGEEIGEMYQHE